MQTHTTSDETFRFSPSLQEQRLAVAAHLLRNFGASTVVDAGCGEGDLLCKLRCLDSITDLSGVDVNVNAATTAATCLRRMSDKNFVLSVRRKPLNIRVWHGDLLNKSALETITCELKRPAVVVLLEVIEHMEFDDANKLLINTLSSERQFDFVLVSTPNAEFNSWFGMAQTEMRHSDHKFECNQQQFRQWCCELQNCAKQQFHSCVDVSFIGIGEPSSCPLPQYAIETNCDGTRARSWFQARFNTGQGVRFEQCQSQTHTGPATQMALFSLCELRSSTLKVLMNGAEMPSGSLPNCFVPCSLQGSSTVHCPSNLAKSDTVAVPDDEDPQLRFRLVDHIEEYTIADADFNLDAKFVEALLSVWEGLASLQSRCVSGLASQADLDLTVRLHWDGAELVRLPLEIFWNLEFIPSKEVRHLCVDGIREFTGVVQNAPPWYYGIALTETDIIMSRIRLEEARVTTNPYYAEPPVYHPVSDTNWE